MTRDICLVCGGKYRPSALKGLLQCTSCQFVTADLALSREELERLYSAEYFLGQEYKDYVGERPLIERHFRERLKVLSRHIGDSSTKRLLEIGSAYGFFLSVAKHDFLEVQGIDISAAATTYARNELGLNVVTGDFLDHHIAAPLDLVCMWDTIEHLAEPDLYIAKASASLKAGGHIAITTGDIGSMVARLRGERWRQIHPPTHLHYFSRATLTKLLAKHGLTVRYCGYDGMYRSVDTMAYIVLAIKNRQVRLYEALRRTGALNWALYLNLRDIMFIVATKEPAGPS